jgi:hypothetical protein
MAELPKLTAGINFPWKYIEGLFMLIRSFTPLTQIVSDKVGTSVLGTFGFATAELPNPDVQPSERIVALPIKNKSDYKSLYRGYLDSGIKSGANEMIILYEHRKSLLGGQMPCFHVALYPTGTWSKFFEAVANYKSQEFKWPQPLILYQPSSTNIFPATKNIFRK